MVTNVAMRRHVPSAVLIFGPIADSIVAFCGGVSLSQDKHNSSLHYAELPGHAALRHDPEAFTDVSALRCYTAETVSCASARTTPMHLQNAAG